MFFLMTQNFVSKWQVGFQTPASPIMEGIVNFHHDLFFFITAISFSIIYMLIRTLVLFNSQTQTIPLIVVRAPLLEII
jgi:heme/copper-type cytochrome/quinol oxidase subunit 2